jgi:hypothetical protein
MPSASVAAAAREVRPLARGANGDTLIWKTDDTQRDWLVGHLEPNALHPRASFIFPSAALAISLLPAMRGRHA